MELKDAITALKNKKRVQHKGMKVECHLDPQDALVWDGAITDRVAIHESTVGDVWELVEDKDEWSILNANCHATVKCNKKYCDETLRKLYDVILDDLDKKAILTNATRNYFEKVLKNRFWGEK